MSIQIYLCTLRNNNFHLNLFLTCSFAWFCKRKNRWSQLLRTRRKSVQKKLSSLKYIDNVNVPLWISVSRRVRSWPATPGRLIDDEGAKRKVHCLIANIGNYAILAWVGVVRHLLSPPPPLHTGFYSFGNRRGGGNRW